MKIFIHILAYNRPAQTEALIKTFLKNKKGNLDVYFKIIYEEHFEEYLLRDSFNIFIENNINNKNIEFVKMPVDSIDIDNFLVPNNLNLVLPGNTIFTRSFNLNDILDLDFKSEYLDLFKGLNRLKQNNVFINISSILDKKGSLYYLRENIQTLEYQSKYNLGKIFFHDAKNLKEKNGLFFGISPCFISTLNYVKYVDDFLNENYSQYSLYAMGLRYLMGESIDFSKFENYCGNQLLDNITVNFKSNICKEINSIVDNIYYINLNSRTDRLKQIQAEISKYNIKAKKFEGVRVNDQDLQKYLELRPDLSEHDVNLARSRLGCTKSHLNIIEKAKFNNYDCVFIMEDDCHFIRDPRLVLNKAFHDLKKLPECDILYLGANFLSDIIPLSKNIAKVTAAYTSHSYIVFKKAYEHILSFNFKELRVIDELYMNMSRDENNFNMYTTIPIIAVQRESYSDIEQKHVDYSDIFIDSYNNSYKHDNK